MGRPSKYSPELRDRAVRMVQEHAHEYPSQWAAIRSVAEKLDCTTEGLRRWVRQAERDQGRRPGVSTSERARVKELERENRELKRANDILRKASAFFAQAELLGSRGRRNACHSSRSFYSPSRNSRNWPQPPDGPSTPPLMVRSADR